jgi:hypothetical protein
VRNHEEGAQKMTVAVLFARADSHYRALPECDVWDKARDARKWPGGCPVIAHPPCRGWGRLRGLANPEPGEKELAFFAIDQVQRHGGVLEHPAGSTLWRKAHLPAPMERGVCGWTLPIDQFWFGHRAKKATWLYIVGIEPEQVPRIPIVLGDAPCVCGPAGRRRDGGRLHKGDLGWRPEITKAERELTPPALAAWLVALARQASVSCSLSPAN